MTAKKTSARKKKSVRMLGGAKIDPAGLQIAAWKLAKPELVASIDRIRVGVAEGVPRILLVTDRPDGQMHRAFGIWMAPHRFKEALASFENVTSSKENHIRGWAVPNRDQLVVEQEADFEGVEFHRLQATIVRGGCGPDVGMIDFYSTPIITKDVLQFAREEGDVVVGVLRAFFTPPALHQLLDEMVAVAGE